MLGAPELDAGLQVGSHQSGVSRVRTQGGRARHVPAKRTPVGLALVFGAFPLRGLSGNGAVSPEGILPNTDDPQKGQQLAPRQLWS